MLSSRALHHPAPTGQQEIGYSQQKAWQDVTSGQTCRLLKMIKKHLSHTWMIELCNWGTKPSWWSPYLLGLLAMIKCSICSYQCDNWYVSNWRLACHINLSLGRCPVELAQGPSCVALVRGFAILEKTWDDLLEKFLIQFPEQTNPW